MLKNILFGLVAISSLSMATANSLTKTPVPSEQTAQMLAQRDANNAQEKEPNAYVAKTKTTKAPQLSEQTAQILAQRDANNAQQANTINRTTHSTLPKTLNSQLKVSGK